MVRTWLITGADSGFGHLATERLLARGERIAAFVRRPERLDAFESNGHDDPLVRVAVDRADETTIAPATDRAFPTLGSVISNADYGRRGGSQP